MEKTYILYSSFAFLFAFATATCKEGACSQTDSSCSTDEECCSVTNGKSYCNLKTRRCEALRYCDESSPNECPFNDLSMTEIENVIDIIKKTKSFSSELQFPIVRKQEPNKKLWNSGDKAARQRIAYAAVYDLRRNYMSEVLVSLGTQRVLSVKIRKDSIPPMMSTDYSIAEEILRNDTRIKEAYERRGLNATYAALIFWAFGSYEDGNVLGRRRVRLVAHYKDPETKYIFWRPVEGLSATIDIADKKIVNFIDKGSIPVPNAPHIPDSATTSHSTKFEKSAIEINGYSVKWHSWKFQYSMDPAYGLQMYHIRYVADCKERFLIYKLSISEMFVPYGADGETWRWRGAFDAGEYGLGKSAAPLVLGRDVPVDAKLLSCPQVDDTTGDVSELKGCVAMYERDASPLYKYYDGDLNVGEVMSGTEMVITFSSSVGSYTYMFNHIFSMDGNIEVSVAAAGIVLPRGIVKKINDPSCIEDCEDFMNENLVGPVHQHFFNYRIDFDIDGANNLLTEVDFVNDPKGTQNPDGGAFSLRRTLLHRETFRDYSTKNARFWSVINAQSRNKFNTPRGYSLHSNSPGYTFLQAGSQLNQAMFIAHPIWVTVYNDNEHGAAGTFSRSAKSGQGLPEYVKNRESLDNTDLVVWHTFAYTHAPRPEEYPVMNKMNCGFHILSRNFQSANPNLSKCENREST